MIKKNNSKVLVIIVFILISYNSNSLGNQDFIEKMKNRWNKSTMLRERGSGKIPEINAKIYWSKYFCTESREFPELDLSNLKAEPPRSYNNKFHWDDKYIIWEIIIEYPSLEKQRILPISIVTCDPNENIESFDFNEKFPANTTRHVIYIEITNSANNILYGTYTTHLFIANVKIVRDSYQIIKY